MKNSAIANVLWKYHDTLIERQKWWQQTSNDPHGISKSVIVSLGEQVGALGETLIGAYGPREELGVIVEQIQTATERPITREALNRERREKIALIALRALLIDGKGSIHGMAKDSIRIADALIAELDKK